VRCSCSKEINAKYETYVLNVGDFDERIFLGDDSMMEIGTPAKGSLAAAYESSERLQITQNLLQNYHDVSCVDVLLEYCQNCSLLVVALCSFL